uniref:Response regulatory domain-containing protein n=1 Tax=Periphykon beckeri TaxID=2006982 RepID=A0A1Z1M3W2_9FLOR|nr:hypothetical protein [Periphykon beckeri]ARW60493.1 hypothetical protein [Periphykon beckeri]
MYFYLVSINFFVGCVKSIFSALAYIKKYVPNLVISDIIM